MKKRNQPRTGHNSKYAMDTLDAVNDLLTVAPAVNQMFKDYMLEMAKLPELLEKELLCQDVNN